MPKETNRARIARIRKARESSVCSSKKIQYKSEREANQVLLSLWRQGKSEFTRAYLCPSCQCWHLTSKEKIDG